MRQIMWGVYTNWSKLPRAIFASCWKAKRYVSEMVPAHVKTKIVRIEVSFRREYAIDIFKHEYLRK